MKNRSQHNLLILERKDLIEASKDKDIDDILLKDVRGSVKMDVETHDFVVFLTETHKKVLKDRLDIVGVGVIDKRKKVTKSQQDVSE